MNDNQYTKRWMPEERANRRKANRGNADWQALGRRKQDL